MVKNLSYIDLFCGIGSFHYSFQKLGWECKMACDINESARNTYEHNYTIKPLGDVTSIEPSTIQYFDVLCAGFPCFIEGTLVLTNNGYKPIEKVTLDDKLLTHTGIFQSILNTQQKVYNGKLYSIYLKYHPTPVVCTEEHPFYVRTKNLKVFKDPEWKQAKDITNNDYFGMVINRKSVVPKFIIETQINQYSTQKLSITLDNIDMWFMMGYFVGDGWIEETCKSDGRCMHKIRFVINNKDEEYVINRISQILKITDKNCDSGKCKKFGCADQKWYTILQNFGKYAHGKKIPEWVQDAPIEYIQEFINGYLYADGCTKKGKITHITTVSYDLALGLQRLYLKLGYIVSVDKVQTSRICSIDGRIVNERSCYSIRNTLNLTKKQCAFIDGGYAWFPHKHNICTEDTTERMVYNFEVENDNSYIVSNTIAHNCQAFSQCGHHRGFDDERGLMFFQVMKFVTFHHPPIIVLENVPALLTHDNKNTFIRIKYELEKENYVVKHKIIKCSDYGIPQIRRRLFIIAIHNTSELSKHADKLLDFSKYEKHTTLSEYLEKKFERDYAYTIRCGGRNSPITDRHNWDGYIVDGQEYRLSISDVLRLQGFDTNFHLCGTISAKWKQLGNTIPTIFTEMIGQNIEMYWK